MAGEEAGGGLSGQAQDILQLLEGGVGGGLGGGGGGRGEEEGVERLAQQLLAEGTRHRVQRESWSKRHTASQITKNIRLCLD